MKRKIIRGFISLSVILCFLLSGCAGNQDTLKPADQGTTQQEPSPPAAPSTEEKEAQIPSNESEEPTQENSDSPEDSNEPIIIPEAVGDRLAKTYSDMMASGKYFMKYRMNTDGETITAEIAYNGDDIATKTVASGIETRMVIKDNKLYMIDSSTRTGMVMSSEDYEGEEDDVDYAGLVFVKDGQGNFLGQTLPYEEYSVDGTIIKYFFEGKKLAGMEMNYEGMIQVLEILELSKSIPSDMFDIPKDYEKRNLG